MTIRYNRVWAMPNKNTFSIKPIKELIQRCMYGYSIDPFANVNTLATVTNDINPEYCTDSCTDALDFLRSIKSGSVDTVLFDPPYSPRQVSECYKRMDKTVNMQTTQSSFWSKLKKEIARVTHIGSIVISCSWNTGGIGKGLGFELKEVLLVPHGGWHNDTIVVVESKVQEGL